MDKALLQQLDSIYCENTIGGDHVAHNQFYWSLLQLVNRQMKLPILGEARTGMQIPLDQLPSVTGKFPNAAVEVAFYEQGLLERLELPVPSDYYKRHTLGMSALYVLNTSACVVAKKDSEQHSVRSSSLEVAKSIPKDMLENYSKRHEEYLAVDARPDIERGVLKSIELRGTSSHRVRLYCVQTQLKGCTIVPCCLVVAHMKKLLRILNRSIVTIRYKQENGNILTLTASLRMDFLKKHCGSSAEAIQSRCRNACNEMEITLPVIPAGTSTAKILTMNILSICSVCKAKE
jgi:hypothetical protein